MPFVTVHRKHTKSVSCGDEKVRGSKNRSTYETSSVEMTPTATATLTMNRGIVIMEALDSGGMYKDLITPSQGE